MAHRSPAAGHGVGGAGCSGAGARRGPLCASSASTGHCSRQPRDVSSEDCRPKRCTAAWLMLPYGAASTGEGDAADPKAHRTRRARRSRRCSQIGRVATEHESVLRQRPLGIEAVVMGDVVENAGAASRESIRISSVAPDSSMIVFMRQLVAGSTVATLGLSGIGLLEECGVESRVSGSPTAVSQARVCCMRRMQGFCANPRPTLMRSREVRAGDREAPGVEAGGDSRSRWTTALRSHRGSEGARRIHDAAAHAARSWQAASRRRY